VTCEVVIVPFRVIYFSDCLFVTGTGWNSNIKWVKFKEAESLSKAK